MIFYNYRFERLFKCRPITCWVSFLLMSSLALSIWYVLVPRYAIAQHLKPIDKHTTKQLIENLRKAIYNSEVVAEREQIKRALVTQGQDAVPDLCLLLASPELALGEAAADTLQAIGTPQATDAVVEYSLRALINPADDRDDDGPGRYRLLSLGAAALPGMMLAYTQHATARPLMREHARYMMKLVEVAGAAVLKSAGLPLVDLGLKSLYGDVVLVAAIARGRIGGHMALPQLLSLLDIRMVQIQMRGRVNPLYGVVVGLEALGDPAAVEPLFNLLERLGPEPQDVASIAARTVQPPLQSAIQRAIDKLTGQSMKGDMKRIREWLYAYNRQLVKTHSK